MNQSMLVLLASILAITVTVISLKSRSDVSGFRLIPNPDCKAVTKEPLDEGL